MSLRFISSTAEDHPVAEDLHRRPVERGYENERQVRFFLPPDPDERLTTQIVDPGGIMVSS